MWRAGAPAPWHGLTTRPTAAEIAHAVSVRTPLASHVPPFEGARASAVLIALADGPVGTEVLLTRRTMHLSSHRGEISFPGGRVEVGETFEHAAVREAHEEVGLPADAIELVGTLDPLSTVVSLSFIVPVVGVMRSQPALRAADDEVDRILWVPLAELTRDDTYREEWWGSPPTERPIFFFHLDDETVWGATARILHQLLRVAHGLEADEPPA